MRFLGSLLIGTALALTGFFEAAALEKRCRVLRDIKTALKALEGEIGFLKIGLERAFLNMPEENEAKLLFEECAKNIGNEGFSTAWTESVNDNLKKLCLKKEDGEILKKLSAELGKTNSKAQIEHLKYIESLIDERYFSAVEEAKSKGRLYMSGGALCGVLTVIIIL